MPSSTSIEYAEAFGALDSDAAAAAAAGHAHVLREIARNANRHADQGGPLFVHLFNADETASPDGYVPGSLRGRAQWPGWTRILPGPIVVPHKPNLHAGELRVIVETDDLSVAYLQVATTAHPFDPSASPSTSPNVVEVAGAGEFRTISLDTVRLGSSSLERLEFWIQGSRTDTLMAAGFGASSGTVDRCDRGSIYSSGAAWDATINNDPARFYILFFDPDGNLLISPRSIQAHTILGATSDYLLVEPDFSQDEVRMLLNAPFEIHQNIGFRFASIALWERDGREV